MTNTSTPTTSKLFPWQHEVATPPHQTTASLYTAYELPTATGHPPNSGCIAGGHGELYPTFWTTIDFFTSLDEFLLTLVTQVATAAIFSFN